MPTDPVQQLAPCSYCDHTDGTSRSLDDWCNCHCHDMHERASELPHTKLPRPFRARLIDFLAQQPDITVAVERYDDIDLLRFVKRMLAWDIQPIDPEHGLPDTASGTVVTTSTTPTIGSTEGQLVAEITADIEGFDAMLNGSPRTEGRLPTTCVTCRGNGIFDGVVRGCPTCSGTGLTWPPDRLPDITSTASTIGKSGRPTTPLPCTCRESPEGKHVMCRRCREDGLPLDGAQAYLDAMRGIGTKQDITDAEAAAQRTHQEET